MNKYLSKKQNTKKEQVITKPLLVKLKLSIGAGSASMTPPLGPVLGQYGINIMEFCNEFNTETAQFEKNVVLKVNLYINVVKAFYFEIDMPKVSVLLKEMFKENFIKSTNNKIYVSKKELLQNCYKVAIFKCGFNNVELKDYKQINQQFLKLRVLELLGNCKSMGIYIKDN
uniref:Ribosomal protein L11 n=1 Tax=Heterostelium pallidum TaxID=13642 RepID=Q5ILL6_HETPA|nr:ribosomal protein L11 [Heterostelium pallidum]AAU00594.1 ribosomal protein L11 [Heterostelium pallidum]